MQPEDGSQAVRSRTGEILFWLAVVVAASVVTAVVFADFLPGLRQRLIGAHNDVIHIFLIMKWQWQVLLDLQPLALLDAPVMYPLPHGLAVDDNLLALTLVGLPFAAFGEEVLAYNVALLSTFVFTAVCGAGFCRALTGSRAAGVVGGLACAFFPVRLQTVHHINNLAIAGFALAAWALVRWHANRRWRWVVIGGVAAYVQFLSSIQLFIMLLLLCGTWLVALWAKAGFRFDGRVVVQIIVVASCSAVALLPWAMPYASSLPHLASGRSTEEMHIYRATIDSWVGRLAPGPVVTVLLAVAVVLTLAYMLPRLRRTAWLAVPGVEHLPYLLALVLLSVAISFGPYTVDKGDIIRLPFYWMMRVIPFLDSVRVAQRVHRLAMILAAGAAMVAMTWLAVRLRDGLARRLSVMRRPRLAKGARWIPTMVAIVTGVVLVVQIPPTTARGRAMPVMSIGAALDRLPPDAVVLPIPFTVNWPRRPPIDLAAIEHGFTVVGGYASGIPSIFWALQRRLDRFPEPEAFAVARATGATHILCKKRSMLPEARHAVHALIDGGALERVREDAHWLLVSLRQPALDFYDLFAETQTAVTLRGPSAAAPGQRVTLGITPVDPWIRIDAGGRRHLGVEILDDEGRLFDAQWVEVENPHVIVPGGLPYQFFITAPRRPGRYEVRLIWPSCHPCAGGRIVAPLTVIADLSTSSDHPAWQFKITDPVVPAGGQRDRYFQIRLRVRNEDDFVWLARSERRLPADEGALFATLRDHQQTGIGRPLRPYQHNVVLPHDLAPGDFADITLSVRGPKRPGVYNLGLRFGSYHLERNRQLPFFPPFFELPNTFVAE